VSVNFSHAVFSLLSTRDDLTMQALLGYAWFGSERSGLAWLTFVHHAILRQPILFKHQI